MSAAALPRSIEENPRLDQWVDFSEAGVAQVFTAKVELGQGIVTAIAQIAAHELRLPLSRVQVISGDTRRCPRESYTAGSMSIEIGGTSVRMACAEAREALVAQAAAMLSCAREQLSTNDGAILLDGKPSGLDYWKIAPHVDWKREISGTVAFASTEEAPVIGTSATRHDLPQKILGGGAYIHDLELPGMIHGRVLRPPSAGAHLVSLNQTAAERIPGVVKIWQNGDFIGVCCEREYQAVKALEALNRGAEWNEGEVFPISGDWSDRLPTLRSIDSESETGEPVPPSNDVRRLSASYSKPPLAHASMAPSCAIACFDNGRLTVWSHSQGVFPLRDSLSKVLNIDDSRIDVIHVQGAGVYGHNGADDVAMDAALLALQVPSRPVRVQWTREDELAWSPHGSPMVVKIEGALSPQGKIVDWTAQIWSGPHNQRPGSGGVNLLAGYLIDPPVPAPDSNEALFSFMGGDRNSQPAYDLPHRKIVHHKLPGLPMRLSALRTLGGFANVFAIESFMDELAREAKADPVEFRLRHLSDPRAREVIETAARMSEWKPGAQRGTGRGMGIGFARYKTTAAYVAVVAEVEADEQIRVRRMYAAADAGLMINPDGVINQIEGGIIQAVSWTLKEHVMFDGRTIGTRSWEDYPILRFGEVPAVEVQLIHHPEMPPLGVGEASSGPAGAAIANAVAVALDVRVRNLPITRERIITTS